MDKPFKYIIDTSIYNLRWGGYGYRRTAVDSTIEKCITDTATHYDQTQVTPGQFKKMVDKITQGALNSPVAQRGCLDAAIQAICIYYPGHMTATNVTNLIKCMKSTNVLAVEYIESTGYKFTSSQIKALNKAGILMVDKMESMTLAEFYSLFTNEMFKNKINKKWDVDPDTYGVAKEKQTSKTVESELETETGTGTGTETGTGTGQINIDTAEVNVDLNSKPKTAPIATKASLVYPQYKELKKIIDKFEIELDAQIWDCIMPLALTIQRYSNSYFTVRNMLNYHRVVVGLGGKPDKRVLDKIIDTYKIDNKEDRSPIWFNEILDYYEGITFSRQDIIHYVAKTGYYDNVKLVMNSKYCSYDPMMDLYYWMNASNQSMLNELIERVITERKNELYMHIISMYHVSFPYFERFVIANPTCGWDNDNYVKILLSFVRGDDYVKYFVDNKLILNQKVINYQWDRWSIDKLYAMCTSYDESGFDIMLEYTHEKSIVITGASSAPRYTRQVFRVLESMSSRDQRIMSNYIECHGMSKMSDIIIILRYDIRITNEYLKYLLSVGHEDLIIRLLHISKKYYYLIDMIDLQLSMECHNYLPRMWFYHNIVMPKLIEGLETSEFEFALYDGADNYIFSIERNDTENADLPVTMENKMDDIKKNYIHEIQQVQETALDRILTKGV